MAAFNRTNATPKKAELFTCQDCKLKGNVCVCDTEIESLETKSVDSTLWIFNLELLLQRRQKQAELQYSPG